MDFSLILKLFQYYIIYFSISPFLPTYGEELVLPQRQNRHENGETSAAVLPSPNFCLFTLLSLFPTFFLWICLFSLSILPNFLCLLASSFSLSSMHPSKSTSRSPFQLTGFSPQLVTLKRITPCWGAMTSFILGAVQTQRIFQGLLSVITLWAALRM